MPSDPPPSLLAPGMLLDRYELICPLAQGGMAEVWVARMRGKHGFEKLVAIKTILAQHAGDPRFEKMFLDEGRLIAKIRHPNVCEILDLGEQQGMLYLVLEWVEGDSLSSLRRAVFGKSATFPPGIALRIVADACAGLHAAHELRGSDGKPLGVVHRDVSPANVLLGTGGSVKLIDFGVAKAMNRLVEETASGIIKGKVSFMAPEQALGKPVDRRADVWAAGAILYQLLSGKLPFEGENQLATLHLLSSGKPAEPIEGLQPDIWKVVERALQHDVASRFATAAELQRALEETMAKGIGPTTSADVARYVAEHLARRLAQRKRTVERSLSAADERAKFAAELAAQVDPSDKSGAQRLAPTTPSSQSLPGAAAPGSASGAARPPLPGAETRLQFPLDDKEKSSPTLGSAAIDSSAAIAAPPRRRHLGAVVGGAVAIGAVILGVALLVGRSETEPGAERSRAAAEPLATTSPVPVPVVTATPQPSATAPTVTTATTDPLAPTSGAAGNASASPPSVAKRRNPSAAARPHGRKSDLLDVFDDRK